MQNALRDAVGTVRLGGREVCRLGFGAMRLIDDMWGQPPDRDTAIAVLRSAVDAGVRLIDTADSYGPETNETLIADALHPYPDDLVIATKAGLVRSGPGPQGKVRDCRPEHVRAACEGSLRRLRVDAIDLYQLHTVDPKAPYEESVGALRDLQAEGKVRSVGVCNVDLNHLAAALRHVEIVSVQNRYSVADRDSEPVLDECASRGISFLAWFPLAAGSLAARRGALDDVARRLSATPAQLALAWLLHHSPVVTPIPGTSSIDHLGENLDAVRLSLTQAQLEDIEEAATLG